MGRRSKWQLLVLLFAVGACGTAFHWPRAATVASPLAKQRPAEPALPLDPAVLHGRLPNGLTYFVRANRKPEQRADLWLVVDAGSILEDDDQRGLAHFVEHMAFNGTQRFAKRQLVELLESMGMRFGADLNASTGFDETVYTLRVPTDRPELLARAFDVLEQWACCVAFDPREVDAERGVVVEEWRLGRGAAARVRDRQLPVLWHGSRYAERLPIGDMSIIQAASPTLLRRYYDDWYRPDLMAVIAVGDFDAATIAAEIGTRFARLAPRRSPRHRFEAAVPPHPGTLADVTTDPELTVAAASIEIKTAERAEATRADFRRTLVESLYAGLLNARLDELRRQPDPPFLFAAASTGGGLRTADAFRVQVGSDPARLGRAVEAMALEMERVRRHGFAATELERAQRNILRGYEQAVAEKDRRDSADLASELARVVLEGEAAPGIEQELAMVRELLPSIGLTEVQRAGELWSGTDNRVLLASGPRKEGVDLPAAATLLALVAASRERPVEPYEDRQMAGPLVAQPPAPGSILAETSIDSIQALDWRLANGVRVVLKPTEFQQDQVLLTGWRPGGHSTAHDEEFLSASMAAGLLREGGLGEFDATTLRKALAGKVAGAAASIGELDETVGGSASQRDLESMFELVYLSMTSPRKDRQAFDSTLSRMRVSLENRLAQPAAWFHDAMAEALSSNHPRRRPLTPERLDAIDLDTAEQFFRQRFADANGFTFLLVGSFSPERVRPLVERWLGGLPAAGAASTWKDLGVRAPAGVVPIVVRRGLEPKASVQLVFAQPAAVSREAIHDLRTLADVLRAELRETLREDQGGVYGVGVSGSLSDRPVEESRLAISFGCDPRRVDELVASVFATLERLRSAGPAEDRLQKVRENQRRDREVALRENGFWLGTLQYYLSRDLDPALILDYDALIARVTVENIRAAARRYADPSRYVLGRLLPEDALPAS
jgi:zinc protease